MSKDLFDIPKQLLNEQSFSRFVQNHIPRGFIAISASRGLEARFGKPVGTAQEVADTARLNKQATEALKQELQGTTKQYGRMSYFPVFGTYEEHFIDDAGQDQTQVVDECSFIVLPPAQASEEQAEQILLELGKQLAGKYQQESFLFKKPGPQEEAEYITADGRTDMRFNRIILNDPTQMFSSRLRGGDADRRFTVTDEPKEDLAPVTLDAGTPEERERPPQIPNSPRPTFDRDETNLDDFRERRGTLREHTERRGGDFWVNVSPGSTSAASARYGELFYRNF